MLCPRIHRLITAALASVAVLLASVQSHDASAASASTITLIPATSTIATGDSVRVDVRADLSGEPLNRWSLRIRFDPGTVAAARCEFDDPERLPSSCDVGFSDDAVGIVGVVDPPASGNKLLAAIRFAATGPSGSTTNLNVEVVEFAGASGAGLSPAVNDGTINVQGTGSHGVVRGTVFEDSNENGVSDSGEPGLWLRTVNLQGIEPTSSRPSGKYVIADIPSGHYAISTVLDVIIASICATDSPSSFDPFSDGICFGYQQLFEPTTPLSVEIDVAVGTIGTVDFGGRRLDLQYVGGQAILNDAYAPAGAVVEARHNGQLCGSATVSPDGFGLFYVETKGARELPGCARAGESVTFTVSGTAATQTLIWKGRGENSALNLTAMPNHSWYWLQKPAEGNSAFVGSTVEAVIGDVVCGSTTVKQAPPGFSPGPGPVGFYRLIVPRDSLTNGCGSEGANVKFVLTGQPTGFSTPWESGVHQVDFPFTAKTSSPTTEPLTPVALPSTGGPTASRGPLLWPLLAPGVLIVFGFFLSGRIYRKR
jgi:hypothetical protein